ncbi:hypothetical protein Ancab_036470 [Ancistrocladus abbreviatus]
MGMAPPKHMRNLMGILKDKISLIKATVSLSKRTTSSSFHIAVLRLTTHDPSSPPPDHLIDDILALCHHSLPTASAYIDALISRLHNTRNAYVALKCLFTLHAIVSRGSSLLKDQITHCPFSASPNFLNLSNFRDDFDSESWELSSWVRWYAGVIEQSLIVSRILGFYFSSSLPSSNRYQRIDKILRLSSKNLLKELEALVGMLEQICRAPESLDYQRISLIYEVMKLVGEDYRMNMREIFSRVSEFGVRIERLSLDELNELLEILMKLEDCKEKLILMFLNKKKNDGVWESIRETKVNVEVIKGKRENMKLVRFEGRTGEGSEWDRFGERVSESRDSSQMLLPAPCGSRWLDADRKAITLSMA